MINCDTPFEWFEEVVVVVSVEFFDEVANGDDIIIISWLWCWIGGGGCKGKGIGGRGGKMTGVWDAVVAVVVVFNDELLMLLNKIDCLCSHGGLYSSFSCVVVVEDEELFSFVFKSNEEEEDKEVCFDDDVVVVPLLDEIILSISIGKKIYIFIYIVKDPKK